MGIPGVGRPGLVQRIRHPLLVAGVLVLATKLVFWIYDPWPMVFMGDSATFIHTAYTGLVPCGRSFLYGFLVWLFAVKPHSFYCLVAIQVAVSAVTAILLTHALKKYFATHNSTSILIGLLLALDPMQLMYERFVLTETFSLLVFAVYCIQVFAYLKSPAIWRLVLIQLMSVLLIGLRLSFLIPVLVNVLLVPLLGSYVIGKRALVGPYKHSLFRSWVKKPAWCLMLTHLAVSLLAAFLFHQGYQRLNGHLSHKPPAYQYFDGFWLVSAWAPVLRPEDSPYPKIAELIAQGDEYRLHDIYVRNGQRFGPLGFVGRLLKIEPNVVLANKYSREIALNALKRDPLGVVKLATNTYSFWGRKDMIGVMLRDDEGFSPVKDPKELEAVARRMDLPVSVFQKVTLTKRYHAFSAFWYYCLLHAPLLPLLAILVRRDESRLLSLFLLITSVSIFVTTCALSTQAVYRYAHPFSFVFLLSAGVFLDGLVWRLRSLVPSGWIFRSKVSIRGES